MEFNIFKLVDDGGKNVIEFEDKIPFKSVVWEEKYNDLGKIQAVFPKNADTIELVKVGKFCSLTPRRGANFAYISSVKVKPNEIWAYGFEAKYIWQKKAIPTLGTNDGKVDVAEKIEQVVAQRGQYTFLADAIIPQLGEADLDALECTTVYEYITKALSLFSAGWYIKFYEDVGKVAIVGRRGSDKTDTVRFATIFGNAVKAEYTVDNQSYVNRVYVTGIAGEMFVNAIVDRDVNEIEEYSAFLDLRQDFPKPEDMSLPDYKAALRSRGQMSLIARHQTEKISVSDIDASEFGIEYDLGDIVEVFLDDLKITANMRVTGSTRTIEGNIDKITLELSTVA